MKGFSLVELIIVVSIAALLFGFITINLLGTHQHLSLISIADTFESDIRAQQLKAMIGSTDNSASSSSYGIAIGQQSYTFFKGSVYSPSDPSNTTVQLDSSIKLTTTFPSAVTVFIQGSGEIYGFVTGNNTITLTDATTNQTRTLTLNKYGVITNIQ